MCKPTATMAAWSQPVYCSCYELGHTWNPSCFQAVLDVASHGYTQSFKIYAPLYLLTAILKKRKLDYYKKRLLPEILQSTLFLGTNAFSFIAAFCLWRRITGFYFFFNVFMCGIPAGAVAYLLERKDRLLFGRFNFFTSSFVPAFTACYVAINLERKSRRGMLAIYLFNLATETAFRMLVSRGYIVPIKNGEVLFFSLVTAVYAYLFRKRNGLKEGVLSGLKFILGTSELAPTVQAVEPLAESQPARPKRASQYAALVKLYTPEWVKSLITKLKDAPRHALCRHQYSCMYSALTQFSKMFSIGYGALATVKLLGSLRVAFSKPRALIEGLLHPDCLKLGMFLGSFAGLFKVVNCLLRWVRNKDSELHGVIAGFVAGWSMMFYKSSSIAMYLASKLAEIMYFKGIENGILPYIKWGDILLYSLSTSFVFHVAVFEPHNLRPAYWKFLEKLTHGRFGEMNRKLLEIYGTDADRLFKDFYPKYDPRFTDLAR